MPKRKAQSATTPPERVARKPRPDALAWGVHEFADLCGVSPSYLYLLWQRDRGPPFFMLGSRRLIPAGPGRAWIESGAR